MRDAFARRDWRTVALAGSLLLNLFLLGWAASHIFHRSQPPEPSAMVSGLIDRIIDRIAARLDPADAEILRASYAARRGELPPPGSDPRQQMRKVRAALDAEPFDPAALDAALQEAEQQHRAFERAIRAIAVDAATKMSAAGRHIVAQFGPG